MKWLADIMRKCHMWENSYSLDLYAKALDQSDRSIFQITISFEPFYKVPPTSYPAILRRVPSLQKLRDMAGNDGIWREMTGYGGTEMTG